MNKYSEFIDISLFLDVFEIANNYLTNAIKWKKENGIPYYSEKEKMQKIKYQIKYLLSMIAEERMSHEK